MVPRNDARGSRNLGENRAKGSQRDDMHIGCPGRNTKWLAVVNEVGVKRKKGAPGVVRARLAQRHLANSLTAPH